MKVIFDIRKRGPVECEISIRSSSHEASNLKSILEVGASVYVRFEDESQLDPKVSRSTYKWNAAWVTYLPATNEGLPSVS